MRNLLYWAVLVLVAGCHNSPGPAPVPPDATDAAPVLGEASTPGCVQACAALKAVNCPSGLAANCVDTLTTDELTRARRNGRTHLPLTCADIATVRTVDDANALGACQ